MSSTRLQAILVREHRAYIADHVALGAMLAILAVVISALAR